MRSFLLGVLLAAGCVAPHRQFEEALLDTLPEGMAARSFRFSRNGRIAAYVRADSRETDCIVVNRVPGKPLRLI
jgi:hypothetical protein